MTALRFCCAAIAFAAIPFVADAATIQVPGDQPTIAEGIAVASLGDTVLICSGTYLEAGIQITEGITVRGLTGDPDDVIIDANCVDVAVCCIDVAAPIAIEALTVTGGHSESGQWMGAIHCLGSTLTLRDVVLTENVSPPGHENRGLYAMDSELTLIDCEVSHNGSESAGVGAGMRILASTATISGVSFLSNSGFRGGGLSCEYSSVYICSSVFAGNYACDTGGGINSTNSGLIVEDCVFTENDASVASAIFAEFPAPLRVSQTRIIGNGGYGNDNGGSVIGFWNVDVVMEAVTIAHNFVQNYSGGTSCIEVAQSNVMLSNCIVAFTEAIAGEPASAIRCDESATVDLSCCDIYGNNGGDWIGHIADQLGVNGNICADPMFCGATDWDTTVDELSPCAPANNSCGEQIGSGEVACASTNVRESSWGAIKALYR